MTLETLRLRIRELTPADAPFILTLLNDPDFLRNIGDRNVRTLEDARRYIEAGPMASYARHGFGLCHVELAGHVSPPETASVVVQACAVVRSRTPDGVSRTARIRQTA